MCFYKYMDWLFGVGNIMEVYEDIDAFMYQRLILI